ncbi:MAG: hypothetical protein ABI831_05485 [Betaproteobacteria bacterium]
MRLPILLSALLATGVAGSALAKLPPPSPEAKAAADAARARSAWTEKSDGYKLCQAQDRIAAAYRNSAAASKPVPVALTVPPCADPGPYVTSAPPESKPIEASGAHSPPGTATSPPSTNITSGDMSKAQKK